MTPAILAAGNNPPSPVAPGWQLIAAALAGIALVVVLITVLKLHAFLALIFGAVAVGAVAQENPGKVLDSFGTGFGNTAFSVGILIALGAMFAKLLADSGGADEIVDTIVGHASHRGLPWAMALVGAIIGLPMFFEIGVVLLMPVIYLVARRSQLPLIAVGLPALAGLSAMHGFVPPHPGPLAAIGLLHANLALTLALGLVVAVPAVIVAGPLLAKPVARWVPVEAPSTFSPDEPANELKRRPSFVVTLCSILLPAVLMLGAAVADILIHDQHNVVREVFDYLGRPLIALLLAVVVGMFTLGGGAGMSREQLSKTVAAGLPPVAGIIMIVSAGGGFGHVLIDSGIGTLLADWAKNVHISVLLLAWVLAALIRLATGSATVATITASSLMTAVVQGMGSGHLALVVLAVGAGSLSFSHINDAGFWLVKEFFGMSVGQTVKSWSLMELVLSLCGLALVVVLGLVI